MNKMLDQKMRVWLNDLAAKWELQVEEAAQQIGAFEAQNRMEHYPRLATILRTAPVNLQKFADEASRCWVLGGRFDPVRFHEFIKQGSPAIAAIHNLIDGFPNEASPAAERIDRFIEEVVQYDGYLTPRGSDKAGAALLASLILTALYPNRFADYRRNRWERFAEILGYEPLPSQASYGQQLIWAGGFAGDIVATNTYQLYWPGSDSLWVIAGICWVIRNPVKPQADPIDVEESSHFPEGAEKRRLHLIRERSQTVVSKAKSLALQRDHRLLCEVCDFSFLEAYGELGLEFIEAHHRIPLAQLMPGSMTRVEDLSMVCANCHRILHRGKRMLTVEELRAIVKSREDRDGGTPLNTGLADRRRPLASD